MTKDEALKLALEALEEAADAIDSWGSYASGYFQVKHDLENDISKARNAITAIKEALAQPEQEFFTHSVEQPYDWSEWVCPDPKGYLMKCCDCGLVHEAEFGVVRYKSETEREDCEPVKDPNLQAVFRMRRSEQWSPEDTAHRAGGMPMAQPEQEPVAWGMEQSDGEILDVIAPEEHARLEGGYTVPLYRHPQRTWVGLTDIDYAGLPLEQVGLVRWAEAKLKEKNT